MVPIFYGELQTSGMDFRRGWHVHISKSWLTQSTLLDSSVGHTVFLHPIWYVASYYMSVVSVCIWNVLLNSFLIHRPYISDWKCSHQILPDHLLKREFYTSDWFPKKRSAASIMHVRLFMGNTYEQSNATADSRNDRRQNNFANRGCPLQEKQLV